MNNGNNPDLKTIYKVIFEWEDEKKKNGWNKWLKKAGGWYQLHLASTNFNAANLRKLFLGWTTKCLQIRIIRNT